MITIIMIIMIMVVDSRSSVVSCFPSTSHQYAERGKAYLVFEY